MAVKRLLAVVVLAGLLAGLVVARRPEASAVRTIPLAGTPFTMVFDDQTNRIFVARMDTARQIDFILEARAGGSGRLLRALTLPGSPVAIATYLPLYGPPSRAIDKRPGPSTDHDPSWNGAKSTSATPIHGSAQRPPAPHPPVEGCASAAMTSQCQAPAAAGGPGALLVLSAGPTSGALTILDASTGALRYRLPFFQPKALAVDAQRGLALVGDALNATITVVDVATGRRLRAIRTECCPTALGIDERSGRAVVIDRVAFGLDGSASVVDPNRGTVLGTFPMDLLSDALLIDQAHGLALINGGVPNGDNVSLLDIRHAGPARTIPVGAGPNTLALDPGSGRAAVANGAAGTLAMIQTRSGTAVTVPVGANPDLQAVAGGALFVAGQPYGAALGERDTSWLHVFGANGQPIAAEALMTNPTAAATDARRGLVLLAGSGPAALDGVPSGPGEVWMLDARTGAVRKRIQVGVNPGQVVVDGQAGVAYVLNAGGVFSPAFTNSWMPSWLRGWLPASNTTRTAPGSLTIVDLPGHIVSG